MKASSVCVCAKVLFFPSESHIDCCSFRPSPQSDPPTDWDDLLAGGESAEKRGKPTGLAISGRKTYVTLDKYESMRTAFHEAGHFFYRVNGKYGMVEPTGAISFFPDAAAASRVWRLLGYCWGAGPTNIPFSAWYLTDSKARRVEQIVYKEGAVDTGEGTTFYTCAKFDIEIRAKERDLQPYLTEGAALVYDSPGPRAVRMIEELISLMSSDYSKGEPFTFVKKFIAHGLQRRHTQQGIALVLTGEQGCGKDTFVGCIERIVGSKWFGHTHSFALYMSPHQNQCVLKTFDYIEEGDDICKVPLPLVNAAITSPTRQYNEKHQPILTTRNFASVIISVNNPNPVPPGAGSRRWYLSPVSPARKGDLEWFKEVNDMLSDETALLTIFQYFMQVDLEGFSARTKASQKDTDTSQNYGEQLLDVVEHPIHAFVKEITLHPKHTVAIGATILLGEYKTWLFKQHLEEPEDLQGALGAQTFGSLYLPLALRRGTLRRLTSGKYKLPVLELRQAKTKPAKPTLRIAGTLAGRKRAAEAAAQIGEVLDDDFDALIEEDQDHLAWLHHEGAGGGGGGGADEWRQAQRLRELEPFAATTTLARGAGGGGGAAAAHRSPGRGSPRREDREMKEALARSREEWERGGGGAGAGAGAGGGAGGGAGAGAGGTRWR